VLGQLDVRVIVDVALDVVDCIERLEMSHYDALLVPSFLQSQRMRIMEFASLVREMNNAVAIFYFHSDKGCMPESKQIVVEDHETSNTLVRFIDGREIKLVNGQVDDPSAKTGWACAHSELGSVLARHFMDACNATPRSASQMEALCNSQFLDQALIQSHIRPLRLSGNMKIEDPSHCRTHTFSHVGSVMCSTSFTSTSSFVKDDVVGGHTMSEVVEDGFWEFLHSVADS